MGSWTILILLRFLSRKKGVPLPFFKRGEGIKSKGGPLRLKRYYFILMNGNEKTFIDFFLLFRYNNISII